jgi:hypothetical protein
MRVAGADIGEEVTAALTLVYHERWRVPITKDTTAELRNGGEHSCPAPLFREGRKYSNS